MRDIAVASFQNDIPGYHSRMTFHGITSERHSRASLPGHHFQGIISRASLPGHHFQGIISRASLPGHHFTLRDPCYFVAIGARTESLSGDASVATAGADTAADSAWSNNSAGTFAGIPAAIAAGAAITIGAEALARASAVRASSAEILAIRTSVVSANVDLLVVMFELGL
jgi:hypothetical protein